MVNLIGPIDEALRSCSIGINRFWFDGLVGFFRVLLHGEKLVSVGLVDQLFQPASNQVETVEKAFS